MSANAASELLRLLRGHRRRDAAGDLQPAGASRHRLSGRQLRERPKEFAGALVRQRLAGAAPADERGTTTILPSLCSTPGR